MPKDDQKLVEKQSSNNKFKTLIAKHKTVAVSVATVLAILVLAFGPNLVLRLVSSNKIMPKTTVSDVQVGGDNYQKFSQNLEDDYKQKTVKLNFDGQTEEASYQEAGIEYDYSASFNRAYDAHRTNIWDVIFFWRNVEVEPEYLVDKQSLQNYVISKFGQSEPPKNAEIVFSEDQQKMIINPEQSGVGISIDKIIQNINSQDVGNLDQIDLVEEEAKPEITADSVEALTNKTNQYIENQVAITAGNKTVSPTAAQKAQWLNLKQEDQIHYLDQPEINTQAVGDYSVSLVDGLKKDGKPEEVISGAGQNIVIAPGSEGVKVENPERYQQQITEALSGYQPANIDIKLNVEPKQTKNYAVDGNRWLYVDLSDFKMVAYEGATPVRTFAISSGASRFPTVTGNYKVYAKIRSQTMKGGDGTPENPLYEVPNVEWIGYFYKDYGIHGVYWHNNFGIKNSSHGCVGIPNTDAQWLYNWYSIGTPVIVRN
jgi:lipoprotein-anchoring transpeptidase ErfK/SrfK